LETIGDDYHGWAQLLLLSVTDTSSSRDLDIRYVAELVDSNACSELIEHHLLQKIDAALLMKENGVQMW
jgi:hypothetical protein